LENKKEVVEYKKNLKENMSLLLAFINKPKKKRINYSKIKNQKKLSPILSKAIK